jgi:hypothetical protein
LLDALYQKVEVFFAQARAAQPKAYACAPGCHRCCHADLTVFAIEAERVALALDRLPIATRRAAARRAERGQHCALLDPRTRRCVVYASRPLICRSFGLATLFEGALTWCPLNFTTLSPQAASVLDLDRVNQPLSVMERLASGRRRRRVRLADLTVQAAR